MLENFEYWNNDEFFFALDMSQAGHLGPTPAEIVKFLLDVRDVKQMGCWRILHRNPLGYWCELKHNGSTFTTTTAIDQEEWVWKLLNAID